MEKKFRRKWLTCSCCGHGFYTWPGYKDQDQDIGFGYCQRCQDEMWERNERDWQDLEKRVRENLSEKNRAVMDKLEKEIRRGVILTLMEKGAVTWKITSSKSTFTRGV